ncbi:hypothetical protein RND81_08G182400 [Saponaria officinalis]|uniref:Poly [ADP-ribose] polymerase n=1 Tax=Saponaria officinalis TaxID=3572 RepID=A0AAW1JAK9_SAPOF
MESNFVKVSGNRRKVFRNLKRNKAAGFTTNLSGAYYNNVSRHSALKASSLKLGKRKKPDICKTKCRSYELPRYYTNFLKTGLPNRLMFYQNGGWIDHESEIMDMVRKEFVLKKAAIEVKLTGRHLVFDFVRMVQFDFINALELPMAWIDDDGGCFFPEVYIDVDEEYGCNHYGKPKEGSSSISGNHNVQEIKLQIEIEVNNVGDTKVLENCGETSPLFKRIKVCQNAEVEDSCDETSDVRANEDVAKKQRLEKEEDADIENANVNIDAEIVKEMFLAGMNMVDDVNAVGVGSNSMWEGRLELFCKQVEITRKLRGNANVRYAWLRSTKEASSGIMAYGLGHFGFQQLKSAYGIGLHLAAASCANTSANYCDVDENGVRYMVLCRVIMGNMEMVHAGSKQFHPSDENYDSGVDDLQNPCQYVVWSMNINTHLYPEYVVSFRVPTNCEGFVLKHDHKHDMFTVNEGPSNTSEVGAAVDVVSDNQSNVTCDGSKERTSSLNPTAIRAPQSPLMPFPILFAAFSKHVPSSDMKLVLKNYEQLKNKVISRQNFTKNLRLIVGDAILRNTIMELNSKKSTK